MGFNSAFKGLSRGRCELDAGGVRWHPLSVYNGALVFAVSFSEYANHSATVHEGLGCNAEGTVLLRAVQSEMSRGLLPLLLRFKQKR